MGVIYILMVGGGQDMYRKAQADMESWKKLPVNNCCEWKLITVDTQERSTWRSGPDLQVHLS